MFDEALRSVMLRAQPCLTDRSALFMRAHAF